jgi:UDP-2-acetamido-2,6-beta-L-arabino-hexul-4-ose reductase
MRIAITGADGFIGKNLAVRLRELGHTQVDGITRSTPAHEVRALLANADCVFHLAGVNRPKDPKEFTTGNAEFTQTVCDALAAAGGKARVVLASSTQAAQDNPYGRSKAAAEAAVRAYSATSGAPVHVFRLPNVFGKWARPNYNSAVATFCHNVANGLPISVNEAAPPLNLVYVDDVVQAFVNCLQAPAQGSTAPDAFDFVAPVYSTTVAEVAATVRGFAGSRTTLLTDRVGTGLVRALYSTYISYLPPASFAYTVPRHADPRGEFVEMLKTPDAGQFSYFTAHPGVTRGEHYHHSKTEKFLVLKGTAHFGFRHILSGETHELVTRGGEAQIVETVPGWTHNITNIGDDEMIVMVWANEVFDRQRPDTVSMKVKA